MKFKFKNLTQIILLKLFRQRRYKFLTRKSYYSARGYKHQDGGFILVIVLVMLFILTSLLASYILLLKLETVSTRANTNSNTGFYAAEAGLNIRAKQIQDKFVGFNRPQGDSPDSWENCLNNTGNQGTGDFACISQIFNNQKLLTYVSELDPNTANSITIGPGETFTGLSAQEYRYDVTSVAVGSENLPSAMEGMRFKSRLVPMFQFAAFYDKDLEISPGANMTLNGRVHSNGDLYLNSGATLTIKGQVTTKAALYRGTKRDNTCTNTVNIYNPTNAAPLNCTGGVRTQYSNANLTDWHDQVTVGIPQITVPPPASFNPTLGSTYWDKADLRIVVKLNQTSGAPMGIEVRKQDNTKNDAATNNLWYGNGCSSAITTLLVGVGPAATELVVASTTGFAVGDIVTVGNNVSISSANNFITSINTSLKKITLSQPLELSQSSGSTVRKALVSTSNTFFNNREKRIIPGSDGITGTGTTIRMLNVDIRGLLNCIQVHKQGLDDLSSIGLNDDTDGGLAWFLTVTGPNSNTNAINNYGVRIYNGAYLYSNLSGAPEIKGLTIISDQAIYVQGDYNKGDNPATPAPANEGDDPATSSVIERKRPAAIMADTINVLSNAWLMNDSASTANLTSRVPSPTQINTAFLAATDITQGGNYNGGLENYPRLHEDWSNKTLTFRGSFVSLDKPQHVNGPWCGTGSGCNIYNAPLRNWDYDVDFNNAANLPPLTPRFVYLRQEVFSRNFNR